MAMVILNPTDEEITVTWNGQNYKLSPNSREKVKDAMGRQIIHNYGNRGLISLEYGDEGEIEIEKIKKGRERWNSFWTDQCVKYNQINEQREQTHRTFVKPPSNVMANAKRLGIKMLEPYKLEDTSSKQISLLMEQNKQLEDEIGKKDTALDGLKDQVAELTSNFKQLMSLAGKQQPQGDNGDTDFEAIKATMTKMNSKRYIGWVIKNWTDIQTYPKEVLSEIAAKHEKLYGTPFPTRKPAVKNYDLT